MRFFHLFLLIIYTLPACPRSITAAGNDARDDSRPVLIVLMLGEDEKSRKRDQRFVTELKLALDGFTIKRIETGVDDFPSLLLPERIEHIRPFVEEFDAVATTWVEDTGDKAILLNMVALSTGRALVRIVETQSGPGAETALALAAQELLGEAYLFSPTHEEAAIERVVKQVKNEVIEARVEENGPRVGVASILQAGGGVYGHAGPSMMISGGIGVELWPIENLFFRLGITFSALPRRRPQDGIVTGWGLSPSLSVGYDWELSRLLIGPVISAAATYSLFDMYLGGGDNQTFTWWNFHGSIGLDARLVITERFLILLNPGIGFYPLRKNYTRISNNNVILRTPFIDWSIIVGVLVFI
ncbi:MAG: hypothetical protein GY854_01130 [Deltaproteobacteria bacterium]|nr:hypothetical protein [Deltaproteobacteria bacterium]